ncbi:MAG TPA: hypothetical protein VN622_05425 [Clostridia bacterium]|nr:hypothetical protein [Clostridia bacterium]
MTLLLMEAVTTQIVGFEPFLLLLVVIGWIVTYYGTRSMMLREFERRSALGAQSARAQESAPVAAPQQAIAVEPPAATVPVAKSETPAASSQPAGNNTAGTNEVTEETLVVIAAAVAAFLGKRVRVRQAKLIQPAGTSAWAQQGRVYVQASHNLSLSH